MSLGLSLGLCEHKFKHSFQEFLDLIYTYGFEIEITTHYILHCFINVNKRMTLLETIRRINTSILKQNHTITIKDFFFGNISLDETSNTLALNDTMTQSYLYQIVWCLHFRWWDYMAYLIYFFVNWQILGYDMAQFLSHFSYSLV